MNAFAALIAAAALLAPAPDNPDETNKKALDKFQGTWQVQQLIRDGEESPSNEATHSSVVFDGEKFTIKHGDKDEAGTFKLDAAKKPAAIDLLQSGPGAPGGPSRIAQGIYQFDGDTLTMAVGMDGTARPSEFASKLQSKIVLIVLKRAPK